jgi:UDP-glucose 4-epimerase
MNVLVTGGAGFIGSNLVDRLIASGHRVTAYDNLSTGFERYFEGARATGRFQFVKGDILDFDTLRGALAGHDFVFHLAANADVRFGTQFPRRDLEQNTIGTFNVLEAARQAGVKRFGFSSTGALYGEAKVIPTPEDGPFPVQTSLYAASKLAGEGMIAAYCEGYGMQGYIFRFVSITGEHYSHGHVYDFYKKLKADPTRMDVLGDGTQRKSYLYVQDCIDAIELAIAKAQDKVNIFNLGTEEHCCVNDSIGWICERMGIQPQLLYAGGKRGWVGDNPIILLDTKRISALGWKAKSNIKQGIVRTLDYLIENPWLAEIRG